MSLSAGTRLGPYEIHSLLGAGGMGAVYKARDPRLDRDVAIKVLHETTDRSRLLRFEQEARAIAALSHPNVLSILRSLDDRAAAGTYVSPFWRGALMVALGQVDEGYAQLERSYLEGAPTMLFLGTGWLDGLRGQPRFVDLARRIGLPPSAALPRS